MNVFQVESTVGLLLALAQVAVKVGALVFSLLYSEEAYRAADKLTKVAWVAILAIGVAAQFFLPSTLINLAFTIAALVFFADVRPALAGLRRR